MTLPDLPDAPDIARALLTGYPRARRRRVCERCGRETAEVCGATSGYLCTECALAEWDGLSDAEKLEALGFETLD